jgi:hypothetical protein
MDQSTLLRVATQKNNAVMLAARHMVEVWDAEVAMRRRRKKEKGILGSSHVLFKRCTWPL